MTNPSATGSYVNGDVLDLEVTVSNVGDLDYTSGGEVEFYYRDGTQKVTIGSTQALPATLTTTGAGSSATCSETFDTSVLPASAWDATVGARLVGTTGDSLIGNNDVSAAIDHDRPPLVKTPQFSATNVERGEDVTVTVRADADDDVDTIHTMSFDVEVRHGLPMPFPAARRLSGKAPSTKAVSTPLPRPPTWRQARTTSAFEPSTPVVKPRTGVK